MHFNGLLVGYFKMVPMIATLGTMYIFRGFSFLFSGGEWWFPHQFTEGYMAFATKKILRDPIDLMDSDHCIHIGDPVPRIYIERTTDLRDRYQSESPRRLPVSNSQGVVFLAMTLCGMLAGLSGMLYTANYATCSYMIGDAYEMTAIAICILGGVSIVGGKGKVDA